MGQHVMNRGHDRGTLFASAREAAVFLDLVGELPDRFGLSIRGFALVGNHYHLKLVSSGRLSRAMQWLGGEYGKFLRGSRGGEGAVFKGRYHNVLVQRQAHWDYLDVYVALQRQADFERLQDDPGNSYRYLAGFAPPPEWLDTTVWRDTGGPEGFRKRVSAWYGKPLVAPQTDPDDGPVPPSSIAWRPAAAAETVLEVALAAVGRSYQEVSGRKGRGRKSADGTAVAWALVAHAGLSHGEAGRMLGLSAQAVSKRLVRVREHPTPSLHRVQRALSSSGV